MATMDSSMVNVALPAIMQSFGSTLAQTEWVVQIYLLTITVSLLFWGNLAPRLTPECIYRTGLLIFTTGSLCCGLSWGIFLLVASRWLQALGAAMMMATGPALVKTAGPKEQLGKRLGFIGIATSLGLMTGPMLAGLVIRWFNWQILFLLTVPVGLAVYLAAGTILPAPLFCLWHNHCRTTGTARDRAGLLLWALAVTTTIFLINHPGSTGQKFTSSTMAALLLLTVALWLLFLGHEFQAPTPLIPVDLLKQRFFSMAILSSMLSFMVLFLVLILMPFYLAKVRGLLPDRVGLLMMAVPLMVFFVSPLAGWLHDRLDARRVATSGLGCCLVALLLLSRLGAHTPLGHVFLFLAFLGSGQAMFLSPNSAGALAGVDHNHSPITASLLATARNLGMLLGTGLAGLIFSGIFIHQTGGLDLKDYNPALMPAFLQALHATFLAGALLSLLGIVASWYRGPGSSPSDNLTSGAG